MRLLAVLSILAVTNTLTRTALADEADNGWNVSEPAFSVAAGEARLDIDRGTWISLDVSPDGRTIAFDLLGDIYTLPIDGGTATNISAGLHWDMQPRFSPDGSRIAFTSDRAGGDNVWIMAADGGNAAALTSETFRLLNNPAWSPDGRYIAARKHFTTQRSLGTGEIWLYDIRGGDGVAVVERPGKGFQKELGEPVFTADGSGIYYTQNVTPGDSFVYGQDSNKEVFRIRRITLATGDVDDIAGGPGGAVRAAPSPDGRWLAYVKRVRAKSRLFVKDLESGAERMLVDELDQDMQETWGVHGLYPNMDWLPDSSAIVFWRNGHIERVAIADGSVERIPFRVEDTRRTYPAPRFKVDVAPDEFDTRMVRWAQRADAGERVYYESLGRLYVRDGDAPPRRLTRDDDDGFETYPALSRDGRWVYFVRWNDEALGSLRRVRAGGGRSEALGGAPGHYRELAVSPDGTMLAYRLADGHRLLAPGGAAENGIYVRPVRGGEAAQISETGREPHFGGAGDRVYFVTRKPGNRAGTDNVRLLSANLGGHDERVHATSDFATSLRVAPDDRHVAFIENYQVFVAPLPPLDKPVELGPKASSLPVRRISASGGEYAGWAGAGTVFWSLGPTFKQASLAGIYGDGFEAPATGRSLSLRAAGDRPAGRVALTDARIVTMRGDEVLDNATILIDGNRIEAVGGDVTVPDDAATVSLAGKTIVPGFLDVHGHGPYGADLIVPQQNWSTLAHLAFGVTTIHDPSSTASLVFPAAEYARAGVILSPRLFSTGEIVYGAKRAQFAPVESLDDALAHVRRLKAQGAISVKNYNQPRRDQRQQVVEAARLEGLMVVAEGGSLYHMDMNLVADGNTGVEHTLPQLAVYDDVVSLWSQTNVGYTPTLGVGYGGIFGEDYFYDRDDVWKHPILSALVPPAVLQPRSVRRQKAPAEDYVQDENAAIGKALADAGVLVNTGGHGQREGLATHWELELFVQGGMTPLQALRAATLAPARYLGLDGDLGSLEAGKLADLVVIDGDVTADITVSDQVSHVMLNGRLYEVPSLHEVATGDARPRPFYWAGRPESAIR